MFGVWMERLYNFGLSTGKYPGRSGTLNSYKGVPFSLWKFYLHCKWKRSVLALKFGPLRWVKYCDLTLLIRASTVQIPRSDLDPRGREQPLMVLFWLKLWLNGCRKGWMRLWPAGWIDTGWNRSFIFSVYREFCRGFTSSRLFMATSVTLSIILAKKGNKSNHS